MHTYIIVLKIEDMEVGGVYNFELHCTLVLWFRTTADRQEVEHACSSAASKAKPITLKATERAYFGEKRDLEVQLVERTNELGKLHNKLLDELEKLPDFLLLEPQYSRDNWRPHGTAQKHNALESGQSVITDSLYLIEARGDLEKSPKDVFAEVKFGHETAA